MRTLFFIFILYILLISFQCRGGLSYSNYSCTFVENVDITIPYNTSITYKIHQYTDEEQTFIAYHYPTHSLDFLDIANNKFIKKLILEREGPNRISQVLSLYVHNLDSIFLLTVNQLIGLDQYGTQFLSIRINQEKSEVRDFDLTKFRIWCNPEHNQPIYYSQRYNCIYVGLKPYDAQVSLENYTLPIAGRIDLKSKMFETLPIGYPLDFQTGYYGILDNPHIIFYDDFTIVGFGAYYNLFLVDNATGEIKEFNLESDYIASKANKLDSKNPQEAFSNFEVIKKHFDENPRLAKLRINRSSRNLYSLYYAPKDPDLPHYRTISIFNFNEQGSQCEKIFEWVVDHDRYMSKMFFATEKGLGLIDKTSTDDILRLVFMECVKQK